MEQPYLTRLNNLAAAWPSVYNRIDKHRVQVMKFQREPEGGTSSSPAPELEPIQRTFKCVRVCVYFLLLLYFMYLRIESPEEPVYLCGSLHSHLMYLYKFNSNLKPFRLYDSHTELKESE